MKNTIRKQLMINASLEHVWLALTTPRLWWSNVILEPRVGGMFEEQWNGNVTVGKVLKYKPPELLKLSWKDENWPGFTYVTFSLQGDGQKTEVEFLHEGWEIFPQDEIEERIHDHQGGWQMHLDDLKKACENNRLWNPRNEKY